MNSLFYLTMLIGVGWLMIWAILPPDQRGKGWWPFDMRDDTAPEASTEQAKGTTRRGSASPRGHERGPGSGKTGSGTPEAEATSPAAAMSWRARRDRALSSRRGV
jgi:hypothetical protein